MRVPGTARSSSQSILKEINPEYLLGGLILKQKLQYFSHLMRRTDSLEKTLMLEKIKGKKRRGWQKLKWSDSITNTMDMNLNHLWDLMEDKEPGVLHSKQSQRFGRDLLIEQRKQQ